MKKIVFFLVAFLLATGLSAFATGAQATEEAAASETGPQYGGTLTFMYPRFQAKEPPNPDIDSANYPALYFLDWMLETPLQGDLETFGPKGTGEYPFHTYFGVPDEYLKGNLVESWEVTHDAMVFNIRPGIMWQDVPGVMEAREFTADDLAQDITRFWKSAWKSRFEGIISDVYTRGENSVVVEIENFTHALQYYIGYEDRALISPPETEVAGADKWQNQVGTGPFVFEEHVVGSHVSYKRNPNYWDETTIDGKTYQLPFLDQVILPIVPDQSTQIAALKTGTLDFFGTVPVDQWATLDATAPDTEYLTAGRGRSDGIKVRYDIPPGNNLKVRRAMSIGSNREEIAQLAHAEELPPHIFPFYPGDPNYIPLEELPSDQRELYEYNPEKAKKLLAEAGYPDGFKMDVNLNTDAPDNIKLAELIKDQWTKIGIDLEIKILDPVAYVAAVYPIPKPSYTGLIVGGGAPFPVIFLAQNFPTGGSGGSANKNVYSNPEFDEVLQAAMEELDSAKRTKLLGQAGEIVRNDVAHIWFNQKPERAYWWPWVRNYHGEITAGDDASWAPVMKYVWIDQNMKKEMGY